MLLAALGTNSGIFKLLLVLHILAVIVGIGTFVLNGIYAAESQKRPGPGGLAITEANAAVGRVAEYIIYAVPVLGLLLVWASDGGIEFGDTFVWLSLLLFVIAIGISHAVMFPGQKKIIRLLQEMQASGPPQGGPPPQAAELEATGKRLAAGGMTLNLLLVIILVLMIWKPGLG